MSEAAESAATAVTEAVAPTETSSEPDWSKLPDNLSGAEISKIMEEHKAKQGGAPKKESTAPVENPIKEAAKEAARKYKIKVDGEDVEVDEDELKRGYSHQRAASKILNEGKQLRKQAEEFAAMLKDPEKFFELAEKMGHDSRSLAEKRIARALEEELMDPKEKELKLTKARLSDYERKDAEEKAKVKAARDKALETKIAQEYESQFIPALEEANLPRSKQMIGEMAKYIGRGAALGIKMTAGEAAALVKDDIKQAQARLFKDADAQTLLHLLGEDLANKIRSHDVAKIKSPEAFLRTPERSGSLPREKKTEKFRRPMTAAEKARFRNS